MSEMAPVSILLVEDDNDIADAVKDVLLEESYTVAHAESGSAALAQLASGYRPQAMIVDFGMPEMNGLEFLEACKREPGVAGIPAIVMSAFRPGDLARDGVHDYLQKPFNPDELVQQLARILKTPTTL